MKRQKQIIEEAKKRKAVLDNKEKELDKDENKLSEEYELSERMQQDAKKSLDKAVDANDMLGVKIAWEFISTTTKKLNEVSCHGAEQARIRTDIGVKRKCNFEKLMKT